MINQNHGQQKNILSEIITRAILFPLVIAAAIFALAGRLDYWQGWVYNILNWMIMIFTWILLGNKSDLIKERMKPGQGMKSWDKVYFAISTPMYFFAIIVASLDAGRYMWSPRMPIMVAIIATLVYILGQSLFLWAKIVNRFFSSVVRIQTDRGQTVCKDGPYRYIRHPGYIAGLLFEMATPLILGSYWALIPQAIAAWTLIIRTQLEDTTLQNELGGYREYAREVRWKMVPHLW